MTELLIYQSEDGQTKLQIQLENETLWLTQKDMAELFQVTKQNISLHIQNILDEGELQAEATVKESLTVQQEGKRKVKRELEYYNLDMIISVGYRVKSHLATKFRQWATKQLKEYLIKGFVMDDERLKQAQNDYFDELLERIRDIRSSEKVFWRKVLDIYATSTDYEPNTNTSKKFFTSIQNKMHYATHGHTAAEIIFQRVDSTKNKMGMTSFSGKKPTKAEIGIAKNYLNEDELDTLNRLVTMYLEFAELQAKMRKAMRMNDWIKKLDDFLTISDFELLKHKGTISHQQALKKAEEEYQKYKILIINQESTIEKDFEKSITGLEKKS